MATQDVNYTETQENLIRKAFEEKGAPLDYSDCKRLAAMSEMDHAEDGPRKPRSITAKISRMSDVDYKTQEPTSKDGSPVVRKSDLVTEIAERANIAADTLSGLDKAPKAALVAVRDALAA